jgi:hypothetical protein
LIDAERSRDRFVEDLEYTTLVGVDRPTLSSGRLSQLKVLVE